MASRFWIDLAECPQELRRGLAEVQAERPGRFAAGGKAVKLHFEKDEGLGRRHLAVTRQNSGIAVRYFRKTDAFRALGRLLGEEDPIRATDFSESAKFDLLGVMADVSRNGVLRPDAAKALMRRMALMGINMLILYSEDTYEVPGEPFFGYLRGRYTESEMRDLDDYADALGIEMFPCIQALAHLEQILQWPAYGDYRDVGGVMLAEEERTYELLEKMIAAASAPFRSKRIHLGMDEAWGIGTGRYRERHGEKSAFQILNNHLKRVRQICRRRGLRPMIWSDMYFRIGSKSGGYYDTECVIPPEVVRDIPKDVELVYWDYYHTEPDFYADWIGRHRQLGSEPIMAGGVWTWNLLWAALPFSFTATGACMTACKRQGLRQAFVTLWGDDGMECDVFSALPGIQFFAEHGYSEQVDQLLLRANFRGSCDADFDDWVKASGLDSVPSVPDPGKSRSNVSKWLLWQDPFLAFLDPQLDGFSLRKHYAQLARALGPAARKGGLSARLRFPAQVARVLSLKCDLRRDLVSAYAGRKKAALRRLMKGDLAALRREVDKLWTCHRDMWLATYKPFGLEVIERRYGGLRARLKSLSDRLAAYLDGSVDSIPEFEVKLEKAFQRAPGDLPTINYLRAATPSSIK
jgi:hypothetical protein